MLRNAWLLQLVTDWMGDDAVIVAADDRINGFNTLGDLTRLTGRVTAIEANADAGPGAWPPAASACRPSPNPPPTTASCPACRSPWRVPGRPDRLPAPSSSRPEGGDGLR
jgi:hypothetical protein